MDEVSASPPRLMLITNGDRTALPIERVALAAVRGGVDTVQVREPRLSDGALVELVRLVIESVGALGARVVVNERLDVALAAGADSVHLKSNSLDPRAIRRTLDELGAPGFLVGLSTHCADELRAASDAAAVDYCCVGPLHEAGPDKIALEAEGLEALLREARRAGPLCPYVVLGGVGTDDVALIAGLAAPGERWGLAAIRPFCALTTEREIEAAAARFRQALE